MNNMKFGTKEWADENLNLFRGCEHDCIYCYSKYNTCKRWKQIPVEEWKNMKFNQKAFDKKPKKVDGRLMFPSRHDILPQHLPETIAYLKKWLEVGNDLLIVSKPHYECIKALCESLAKYKDNIVFRFTIGSLNQDVLDFWEHNAPDFYERKASLKLAYANDFQTSVSSEPYLDEHIADLVKQLLPMITDTMWIGKMNYIKERVDTTGWTEDDFKYLKRVKDAQTDEFVHGLYEQFKDEPKIRWKESCKKVLGLPDEAVG